MIQKHLEKIVGRQYTSDETPLTGHSAVLMQSNPVHVGQVIDRGNSKWRVVGVGANQATTQHPVALGKNLFYAVEIRPGREKEKNDLLFGTLEKAYDSSVYLEDYFEAEGKTPGAIHPDRSRERVGGKDHSIGDLETHFANLSALDLGPAHTAKGSTLNWEADHAQMLKRSQLSGVPLKSLLDRIPGIADQYNFSYLGENPRLVEDVNRNEINDEHEAYYHDLSKTNKIGRTAWNSATSDRLRDIRGDYDGTKTGDWGRDNLLSNPEMTLTQPRTGEDHKPVFSIDPSWGSSPSLDTLKESGGTNAPSTISTQSGRATLKAAQLPDTPSFSADALNPFGTPVPVRDALGDAQVLPTRGFGPDQEVADPNDSDAQLSILGPENADRSLDENWLDYPWYTDAIYGATGAGTLYGGYRAG